VSHPQSGTSSDKFHQFDQQGGPVECGQMMERKERRKEGGIMTGPRHVNPARNNTAMRAASTQLKNGDGSDGCQWCRRQ